MKRALMKSLAIGVAAAALWSLSAPDAAANPSFCPPGLAKKDPPCIPPGQVGRTTNRDRDDDRDHDYDYTRDRYPDRDRTRWQDDTSYERDWTRRDNDEYDHMVGDLLRDGDYVLVRNPDRFGLDPYRDQDWRYYLVEDTIVRANPETRQILGVIGLIETLLN